MAQDALTLSLTKLGLEYVDLYLIHEPFFATSEEQLQRKWKEFEAIKASGRAKSIGVSNFQMEHLETILKSATVSPAINQIEYHPYLQQHNLIKFHREHDIVTACYASLVPVTKAKGGPIDSVTLELVNKYAVSDSEVGLRWTIDQGMVTVTTTSKRERLENYLFRLPTFQLNKDDISRVSNAGNKMQFRAFWSQHFAD